MAHCSTFLQTRPHLALGEEPGEEDDIFDDDELRSASQPDLSGDDVSSSSSSPSSPSGGHCDEDRCPICREIYMDGTGVDAFLPQCRFAVVQLECECHVNTDN
jgi:hypothetical protein